MEDWRSSSTNCLTNGYEHYANYNGRSSWGGRPNRAHYRSNSRSSSRPNSRRGSNDFASNEFLAKSNNQKSKPGNKRPAQSKMRLEAKDSRNAAEPNPPATIEATPSAPSAVEKTHVPSAVEQTKKAEDEAPTADDKEVLLVAKKNENNKQATSVKTNDAPAVVNKVVLKQHYESGQWSPDNPDGKKKYDRQFIMGLQNQPQSLRKPTNFPNLELLSDYKQRPFDRNVINSMNRSHMDNIYPSFANKNSSQRGQTLPKRGSQQGKPKAAKPTVVQVSLQQDVKLHETENAWKPARVTEPTTRTEEEAETEALYKRVRGILNKLTPEKFDRLVAQVQELPIDNSERLSGVIDLVFKKAVDEPSFSVAYAQMCRILQKMEVPGDRQQPGKTAPESFRKTLLTKCQNEFEKNSAAELKRDERLKEIEQEKDLEKKKMLQLAFEEEARKIRLRSVGNIRFIGELYKLQMLTCKIMHNCVNHLLNLGDEESLECLCKLLTTIGQGLENAPKKNEEKLPDLSTYFKKLNDIVKNKGSGKVSSRVRFMIQDLIDLKANKWVPRRNESQPKTIDQIQKEAERENMQMNIALNAYQERNKRQDVRNSTDGRKRGAPDSSGWTTVTNSQPNKSRLVVESSKLKLDQSDVEVASTLSLGNRNLFVWGQSASSGKADDKRSLSQLGSNKFALLAPTTGSSSLKGSSMEKDRINSYKSLEDDIRTSKNQPDPNSRSSSRESASSKRDNSKFVTPMNNKAKVTPPPPSTVSNELTPDELDANSKKTKSLLNEYLSILDVNEATKDLNELFPPSTRKAFVSSICCEVMDKKGSQSKHAVGLLMNHFITSNSISKEQFIAGLSEVLETADDLEIDMPCMWKYLAEILVEMCSKEVITLRDVVSALTPVHGSPFSAKLLAALMEVLKEVKDITWIKDRWAESQVSLTEILSEEDINNFVEQNNLEFMLSKNIKLELSRMIAAGACFDEINSWVLVNVGKEKSTEPQFVRTLMTVLLEAAVTKGQSSSYKLDTDVFSKYEQLILRYTNHAENLELPCLFAVQAFVHKLEYPQAILHNIFEYLWDGSLITIESFKSWRNSKDPQEQEGHAVCVTSLTSFFTLLDETETDEEES
ncbi:hypothetical protein RUM44_001655 [Polyplax serrata]|uniref:Uncharacterized protein n=1 Tax=Polyplax serrata TaxID=468196 RepID=A0ABR1AKN7_POLSC